MRNIPFLNTFSLLLAFLCCLGQNAFAESPHLPCGKQSPCLVVRYHLIDLQETDLEPGALTKLKNGPSLGPSINNNATVIGNCSSGGFVYKNCHGVYSPCVNGARINFYDLNNAEDILVGITRSPKSVDWLLWPTCKGWCAHRIPINTVELEGYRVYLSSLNDQRIIVGEAQPDERSMPIAWDPYYGLCRIGYYHKIDLQGTVKSINNCGWVVGHKNCYLENFPFVWNGESVVDLFNSRSRFQPPGDGKIQFEDLNITDDGTIYGTYWINTEFLEHTSKKPKRNQAFVWEPCTGTLAFLELDGMRFSKVNTNHRLVGSINGKAAFADRGFKPTELSTAIDPEELNGWELLEATDINDYGQIVGYGLLDGKMHIFFADPM